MSRSRALTSVHASAEDSTGLLLWAVTNRWQAVQRATLKPFELTHVQFVLLACLTWLAGEGPVTQRQLADHAATDAMMTSQVIRGLERRGLVQRAGHPSDGRARAVVVTDAGARLANRANAAVEATDLAFFAPLDTGAGGFTAALRVLRRGPDD